MSALHRQRPTIVSELHVAKGHNQTDAVQQTALLFDYLVGKGEQIWR
jgi:hypothetical protein